MRNFSAALCRGQRFGGTQIWCVCWGDKWVVPTATPCYCNCCIRIGLWNISITNRCLAQLRSQPDIIVRLGSESCGIAVRTAQTEDGLMLGALFGFHENVKSCDDVITLKCHGLGSHVRDVICYEQSVTP